MFTDAADSRESMGAASEGKYVLITPARNEGAFIELTVKSVVSQTMKPLRWVIVSDGSTDNTDALVRCYAAQHPWIRLIRIETNRERHFAAKAAALAVGVSEVRGLPYDYIGALDADISFEPDYFAFLIGKLAANARLGIVGTPFEEDGRTYDYRFASIEHVSGACQLFRRTCFEEIGGYEPIKSGGIDLVAVLTARMKGWQALTFTERTCTHHRKQGSALNRGLRLILNDGKKDYLLGSHPLWQVCRCAFHLRRRPYILSGMCLFAGYFWPMLRRIDKTAPKEVITFRRRDQIARLRRIVRRIVLPGAEPAAAVERGRLA
jgi:glycosyltransferase involved in cell wall biosynthesis